jgi:outer membrane receptor protein involved in Fe transport
MGGILWGRDERIRLGHLSLAFAFSLAVAASTMAQDAAPVARVALLQPESLPPSELEIGADGPADDVFEGEVEPGGAKGEDELDDLMSMDLDQLVNVDVVPSAITIPTGTLTATTTQADSPYTVTHITREMVEKSGARNLNELLDIFVPNLQVIRHHAHYNHVGIRGIISDREDKYLLRVNGKVMNNHFIVGADSERDLPLLRDIDCVDVIRGPGSTTYGAGAIAGVISITTLNGLTFEGFDVQGRQVFEQYLTTGEMRWGKSLGEESGLFAYYGFADQPGADQDDAPQINGRSGALPDAYPPAVAGQPTVYGIPNDEVALYGAAKHKIHLQYTHDTWDFWARYTLGSYLNANQVRNMYRPPIGVAPAGRILEDTPGSGGEYEQVTFFGSKIWEVSDDLQFSGILSWDSYDYVETRLNATKSYFPAREEELYFRLLGQWAPDDYNALAIGFEQSREIFGLDTRLSDQPTRGQRLGLIDEAWTVYTPSVFGEYRTDLSDPLTVILAARLDKHTYTDYMFSPRISVLLEMTEIDLLKFNIGQSTRKAGDEELRSQWIAPGNTAPEDEMIKYIELRWEQTPKENLLLASTVFYHLHDVIGFTGSTSQSTLLGTFESWGYELEAEYVHGSTYYTISQSYTKLIDGELTNPNLIQGISAAPYGFGNDFGNWSPNLTKFAVAQDLDCNTNVSTSLRVYWSFPGARDLAAYNRTLPTPSGSIGQADPGYDKAYGASVFLDAGYQKRLTDHLSWRLDLYNILGWADIDLNKRNYINRSTDYRSEAAAVGVSATANY